MPKRSHTALMSNAIYTHTYPSRVHGCEQTSERGHEGYDGRFPVERIKNSVLKPWAGTQPFVAGGAPFSRRGGKQAQWRGACVLLVCALFTQPASPPWDRENPLLLFLHLPRVVHPCIDGRMPSPRGRIVGPPRANRTTILLWKSDSFALSLSLLPVHDQWYQFSWNREGQPSNEIEIVVQVYTRFFHFSSKFIIYRGTASSNDN